MPRVYLTHVDSCEIIKKLEAEGFRKLRVNGSHHVYGHEDGRRVVVPHPRKDFPTGTLRNMYRQAGWKWPPR